MMRCTREAAAAEMPAPTGAAKMRASAEMASCHATCSPATYRAATHAAGVPAASTYRAATHTAGVPAASYRAAAHAARVPAASTSHAAATLCERRCRKGKRRAKRTRDDTFKELVAHDQSSWFNRSDGYRRERKTIKRAR
ncbi:hypothetical protein [Bradyrhizobium valentinum]|uniref:hypothetical protein n=1 Tax=Bradyrhizobium valentinum TaxID=1518501 RepID=UPI00070D489E|nr:hypothetical protein CQ10_20725 [Bradyrhizobium valentinum]